MKTCALLSVRRYQEDDLDSVITVFQTSVRQIAARDYTPPQIAAWSQVDRAAWRLRLRANLTLLAHYDGALAGFVSVEKGGYLDLLFTHPARQGMGTASRLLEAVEAALCGVETMLTTEASITARPFFSRRGFTVIAPQQVSVRGETFINYRMEKRL